MDSYFFNFHLKEGGEKIKKQIILAVLITFVVLAAGGMAAVSAQDDFMDPEDGNNFAEVSVEVFEINTLADPVINITGGGDTSILSPSSSQYQGPVQIQTQTSINTNNNDLSNDNVNAADSSSTATNTNHISNTNTFNPILVVSNRNYIGNIKVSSSNINAPKQLAV